MCQDLDLSVICETDLEHALNCLQREDPSLKVRTDPDSGQVEKSFTQYFKAFCLLDGTVYILFISACKAMYIFTC